MIMKQLHSLAILLLFCISTNAQSKHDVIKTNLKRLGTLVGQWEITTENTSHAGVTSQEFGTYDLSWTLDSTYIVRTGTLTSKTTNRTRKFVSWLTFDTEQEKFKWVYFYNRRSNQIIEYGSYDESLKSFTTFTSFEIENGVTEYIRHVLHLDVPGKVTSRAWIRLDDNPEANTFTAIWTRK